MGVGRVSWGKLWRMTDRWTPSSRERPGRGRGTGVRLGGWSLLRSSPSGSLGAGSRLGYGTCGSQQPCGHPKAKESLELGTKAP